MGGRLKLSRADPARLSAHRTGLEKDASTDFCNRPTSRAPCGSIDSRAPPSEPRGPPVLRRVELRLTATLQLRLCRDLLVVACHPSTAPPGPGGAAIDSPSGRRSRSRCFRPRTEHATWPLTPLSRPAAHGGRLSADLRCHEPPGPPPPPPRQRRQLDRTRVPSIDERSLRPVHAPLAQHDPGPRQEPDAVSPRFCGPSRAPEGERAGAAKARPGARRRGPCAAHRLLQSTQSASTTAGPPEPRSAPWEVALFCAVPRLGEIETPPTPEVRLRATWLQTCARAPASITRPGGAEPPLETSLAARSRFRTAPAEVSRARGRTAFATRHLSPRFLAARASPQPDRLGHLVS